MTDIAAFVEATLLLSLRIGPTLAGAGPFGLIRIPATVRVFLALGLAGLLIGGTPGSTALVASGQAGFIAAAATELILGISIALALHLAFGAIQWVGRLVDIQAGFGMALLADPNARGQMPLIGTLFAYAAGVVFFASEAPADLLALWAQSLQAMPVGAPITTLTPDALIILMGQVHVLALGLGALLLLVLFLTDVVIGLMSRTLPQMNVLVLGFQVKTLVLLLLLPLAVPTATAAYLRIIRLSLEAPLSWLGG